jgi:hypothetical protein
VLALGLSAADYTQYMATLRTSHEIKVTVQVLSPSTHGVLSTISHLLLDGQVDCEATEGDTNDIANSRTAILRFLDPKRTLSFESSSPNEGAVFFDRMIRVTYSVHTGRAANGGWVDVPVITGPITALAREGNEVVIEVHGKEEYGLANAFKTYKYNAGSAKVTVIRSLLAISGELSTYMGGIPSSGGERHPKAIVVTGEQKLWPFAAKLASGIMRGGYAQRLFYDARGQAVLRSVTGKPVMTMGGAYPNITSDVKIDYAMGDLRNAVRVTGRKAAGATAVVTGEAVAPYTHPLSPSKLGRNTRPRYLMHLVDDSNVVGLAAARALAKTLLVSLLRQQVQATWECLPIPHLEPWDYVDLVTDKFTASVPVRRFTLPLVVGPSMTVGATRSVAKPKRS